MRPLLKRIIVLSTFLIIGGSLAYGQVVFSDDFEGNNVGDYPAGWTQNNAGAEIVVTDSPVKFGTRALRLVGAQGLYAEIEQTISVSSDYVFEFYVFLPDTGQAGEHLGSAFAENVGMNFALGNSNSEAYIYNSNTSDGWLVATNAWHKVRIEVDYDNNVAKATLNDTTSKKYSVNIYTWYELVLKAWNTNNSLASRLVYFDSVSVTTQTVDLTPGPVALSGPADLSTGLTSPVYTSWSSINSSTAYEIQISTDSTFATNVVVDDTTLTSTYRYNYFPPLTASTQYFWRVRAKNTAGWGVWSEVRRFSTVEPVAPPTLYSPSDMEMVNDDVQIYFGWGSVSGAQNYELIVATDSAFSNVVFQLQTITSSYYYLQIAGNLQLNTLYYWKIRVLNAAGWGSYSEVRSFYTLMPPVVLHSNPLDNTTVTADNPGFSYSTWSGTTDTFFVQIVADTNDVTGTTVVDTSRTSTSFTVAITRFTPGAVYYWRTRGNNLAGIGPWSGWRKFTVHTPPGPPTHYSPNDGNTLSTTTPYLDWSTVSTPYNLQIATDMGFTNIVLDVNVPSSSSYTIPSGSALPINGTFYWRVRSQNNVGWGSFSAPWSFNTPSIPPPPVLQGPAPGTQDLIGNVLFTWNSSPGKDTTHIQVTTDTNTVIVKTLAGLPGKAKTTGQTWNYYSDYYYDEYSIPVTPNIPFNTQFWVRMRDHNDLGYSNFTSWSGYTTQRIPAAFSGCNPANGETGVTFYHTVFSVPENSVANTSYNITVSVNPDLSTPLVDNRPTSWSYWNNYYYFEYDLGENSTYYYRFTAYNPAGTTDGSICSFRTADPYPGIHCTGDVPFDQGGASELQVISSGLDRGDCSGGSSSTCVYAYNVWRLWRPEELTPWNKQRIAEAVSKIPQKTLAATRASGVDSIYIWEPLFYFQPIGQPSYLITLPTRTDSAAGRRYWERYVLTAHLGIGRFYCSNIDSGYSVDNLAPASPAGGVAGLDNGAIRITWQPNTEKDLKEYVVYRSLDPSADVKTLSPIGTVTQPVFVDANPPNGTIAYFIVARDKNDNESDPSVISIVTGVETLDGVPTEFSLGQNYPNPFNPSTTIRFGVPEQSTVRIQVINTLGQVVDEIADDVLPAGFFQVIWNADVPSGLYIYRMVASPVGNPENRFTSIRKMVLLR